MSTDGELAASDELITDYLRFTGPELVPVGAAEQDAGGAVVVVGVDGSQASLYALRQATTVVKAVGGRVAVVYAKTMPTMGADALGAADMSALADAADESAHAAERDALAVCGQAGVEASFLCCDGDPGRAIIDVAHEFDASCVVVGATIHGPIASLFLSSVAQYLLHHCDISLVVVRPERAESPTAT
jgi:nucleotide-binding universal stress UspA family protein